jgi:hypothetical protein
MTTPRTTTPTGLRRLTDPASFLGTYLGIAVAIAGFVFLTVGWAGTAGTLDVGRQVPYLLSAGLPGVSLVMVGLVIVNLTVRRRESAERAQQLTELAAIFERLENANNK